MGRADRRPAQRILVCPPPARGSGSIVRGQRCPRTIPANDGAGFRHVRDPGRGEAYFEHLRGSFNRRLMWTPIWVTPPMVAAGLGAVFSQNVAEHVLPWA